MAVYKIIWSPTASKSYIQIVKYLKNEWTYREAKNFIDRTNEVLKHISQTPMIYSYSKEGDAYRCVVAKQVTLFFRLKNDYAELLIFWDNRMDPEKLIL